MYGPNIKGYKNGIIVSLCLLVSVYFTFLGNS